MRHYRSECQEPQANTVYKFSPHTTSFNPQQNVAIMEELQGLQAENWHWQKPVMVKVPAQNILRSYTPL